MKTFKQFNEGVEEKLDTLIGKASKFFNSPVTSKTVIDSVFKRKYGSLVPQLRGNKTSIYGGLKRAGMTLGQANEIRDIVAKAFKDAGQELKIPLVDLADNFQRMSVTNPLGGKYDMTKMYNLVKDKATKEIKKKYK